VAPTLFASDLHLCQSRPRISQRFLSFLETDALGAHALYILGDLFEYWIGDDDATDSFNAEICTGLRRLVANGTPVFIMRGNRDFLLGNGFASATGAQLLPDLVSIEIAGVLTLLLHGDTLCTDDVEYQNFRAMVRGASWQDTFLSLPLAARRTQVEELRRQSEMAKRGKAMTLMDVNEAAVTQVVRSHGYPPLLIHGHTHRPACHSLTVDGKACQRWVLAAWDDTPSYLAIDAAGCRSVLLR
jgi:UDP-2,3-diacylglucosamine hydrolase